MTATAPQPSVSDAGAGSDGAGSTARDDRDLGHC